ncbi:MAG: precorrin-3B C(17)-methyltransferase, partial [Isosphaeraceae bacterium]|nr:precorrin-3B C(17)-methyltransferase [Isosphaeraceae bacterium]
MNHPRAGVLYLVGLGPGAPGLLTPEAAAAIERAEVVVGYRGYLERIADRLAGKEVIGRALGQEVERAEAALALAESGRVVALVSSGDAGVYGMGGVAWEVAAARRSDVEILMVPGVTAAMAAAARLGAPLAHDFACLSLSDLLTPWETIVARVAAAAAADFVLVLYNPASRARTWQLGAVAEILLQHRDPSTPVGFVENAYREGERIEVIRLDRLATAPVAMFTTVIIGNSQTFVTPQGAMVTPRIYRAKGAGNWESDSGFQIPDSRFQIPQGRFLLRAAERSTPTPALSPGRG